MTSLPTRIQQRITATGKSLRRVSLDGGLSEDTLSKILRMPDNSPTLETIRKLAMGLETTPEWLAYGIVPHSVIASDGSAPNGDVRSSPTHSNSRLDRTYIQVAPDVLCRLVSGALQNESIPAEQADEYANAVLASIEERAVAHIVHRIEAPDRTLPGSPKPTPHGQS